MCYRTDAKHFSKASGICHKVWECTLHPSDASLVVMPQFPSCEWLRGSRDALTGLSRARLCLQERAPALYPRQPGAPVPGHRSRKGLRHTNPAVTGEVSRAHPPPTAVSAPQSSRERTERCHVKKKEAQGHNWESGSAELGGAVLALMFGYRRAVLKVDEKQNLTQTNGKGI